MLKFETNIETKFKRGNDLIEEFRHKIPYYTVNNNIKHEDLEDYEVLIKFCVTIPIGIMHVLVEIEELDDKGKVHFNVFGITKDLESRERIILLSEVAIFEHQIVNIKDVMRMSDFKFNDTTNSIENNFDTSNIQNICTSFLNYYFCRRFFTAHPNTYLDGDMLLDY